MIDGEIIGVVPNSTAYKAGLRNGQQIFSYDIEDQVAIKIKKPNGDIKIFTYTPSVTEKLKIPTYR